MAWLARGTGTWLLLGLAAAAGTLGFGMRMDNALVMLASAPFWGLLLFLLWFFRDPERVPASGVVSPADGRVVRIDTVEDPDLGPCDRLAVFMSPLVVHVNRAPLAGTVKAVRHEPGGHVPAFSKDAEQNERLTILWDTPEGPVKTVQIAGTVARRIVAYIAVGDQVRRGGRIGIIRLGSRCDVLAPRGRLRWMVTVGDRVRAASSTIGEVAS